MVRPPHRTRALGRSRGGIKHFGLSLTASRACDVLTRLQYLPRMTSWASVAVRCSCLNATDDEKIRELVMTVVGQEPGNERSGSRTPLLAPFITHDVLLCVDHILFRR